MSRHILVAGAGPAAHRLVARLRQHGHRGPVTVLGAERGPAYNRMLLPSVLAGVLPAQAITLPDLDASLYLDTTATAIDRDRHLVHTADGATHPYDTLVLATGARPDPPSLRGAHGAVTTLRTLADCGRITGRRVLVLGGGILGVQAALALRRSGHEVTLVHRNTVPLNRLLDAEAGRILLTQLEKAGISVYMGQSVAGLSPGAVTLDDGTALPADSVVLCTGVLPNAELARDCGLPVGSGVLVDHQLRSADPDIHAIGDCAEHDGDRPGHLTRAWDQADTLAALLTGHTGHRAGHYVTRLTAPGVDIAAIGSPASLSIKDPAVEVVTLTDPARSRYAKLAIRDQRIVGAVLVGLPAAIATITQLHDRGEPVPSDRLGVLLGSPIIGTGNVELPEDAVICLCNNVTRKTLVHAWHNGADTLAALARETRATTGCGSCKPLVEGICATLATEQDQAA